MPQAYLQFGTGNEPRQTVNVPHCETIRPFKGRTQTGYGSRIPTCYMVQWNGKWRRVYFACYSNVGTCYIGKPGAWEAIVDIDF